MCLKLHYRVMGREGKSGQPVQLGFFLFLYRLILAISQALKKIFFFLRLSVKHIFLGACLMEVYIGLAKKLVWVFL